MAVVALASAASAQHSFDALINHEQVWTLNQDAFQKATPGLPFEWTSSARDSARAASYKGMTLFGRPVYEFIARFESDKLTVLTTTFYARGDAGEISEAAFKSLLTETVDTITKASGVKYTVRGKDATSAVKAEGLIWTTPKSEYLLEYSFTKKIRDTPFRAEFVRLEIRGPRQKQGLVEAAIANRGTKFIGTDHVKKDATSGDVWLSDVPMVDQGQKGYCVVASTERVMRYYGNDVDANELAQIANSDAGRGTSQRAMRDALKKVAGRLKVRVRERETMGEREFVGLIKDYNRAAKKAKEMELPDPDLIYDVGSMYRRMNGEVLKEARTKNKGDVTRFQKDVQTSIDAGIPLLWSVQLGLFPEPGVPQSGGGHMRLIIGYNPKTEEVLFSDSWGAGHELKRMKLDQAWTITTQVVTIEPMATL